MAKRAKRAPISRAAMELLPGAVAYFDPNGLLATCNQRFQDDMPVNTNDGLTDGSTGALALDDALKHIANTIDVKDRRKILQRWRRAAETGKTIDTVVCLSSTNHLKTDCRWDDDGGCMMTLTEFAINPSDSNHSSDDLDLALLDTVPVPVVLSRANDAIVLHINTAARASYGRGLGLQVGGRVPYVKPEERERLVKLLRKNRQVDNYPVTSKDSTGALIEVLVSAREVTFAGEVCVLAFSHVQTDRLRLEIELKETRDFLDAVIHNMDQGLIIVSEVDKKLVIDFANKRYGELFGIPDEWIAEPRKYTKQIIASRAKWRGGTPSSSKVVVDEMVTSIVAGTEYSRRLEGLDGRILEARQRALPDGRMIRTFTDITELEALESNARAQSEILRNVLDVAGQGIAAGNSDNKLIAWNDTFRKMLGFSDDFLQVGTSLIDLNLDLAKRGVYGSERGDEIAREIIASFSNRKPTRGEMRVGDQAYDVIATPTEDGGLVVTYTDVTERRRSEVALRHQTELLRLTQDNIDQGLILVDPDDQIVLFNNRACELLDIPEEVFRDRPNIHDIIAYQVSQGDFKDPESEIESALAGWAEAKKLGEPFVFERARPNGTIISYWNNPLDDGGMVRTFTDVTERVRAEEAVRRQSELLSITQENMDQGILLVDENDVVVLFNKRVCELLDISEDFMNAHPTMTEMVAHQEAQGEFVEFEESTKTQVFAWNDEKCAREPFVYERHRPDGTILSVWNNPLEGGGMVRTFTDVTERRRAQEAMREGEERLKFIFERSPVAIEVAGHDGEILFANDRAGELFGMPVDRLVGTSINNLYADVSQRGAILAELNESGSVRDAEIRFRRPDGTEVHALVNTEEMEFEGQTGIVGWHYDITERQIMEEQLERQKASLEATLDTMVQGLIAVDPKGRVGLFNRTACELLDLPEEFLASGPTTAEIYDYQLAMGEFETLDPEIKETVKTEAGSLGLDILEYERQRPNGRWLLVMTSPRPDGGYVRTFLDVTERHEIAAELERQRALLKTSLDNMEQGMLVMGADDRVVLYNDRVCEMLDVPASYFDTQPTNPEFWQHQAEMDEFSTLESERRAELDLWVDTEKRRYLGGYERMRPNGMHIWVTINPLPDGGLVETYVDVTERRRAEIDLERQLELQETLIATMPVPVYLLDADRRFTACNESFRALLGQSLDFYLGNTADDVLPERIAGAIGENDEELLTSGGSVRAELRINAEDGSLHDLVLQKAVFTNPDGSPGGIVGVMTDISQEMEARDQLEQAKRAAEEASQAKTSFVANMSHEIRTPLSGITGFLELLTLSNLDTDQRRMVESANLAANSLIELIGDILDFSKIEAGYLAINSTEVEPRLIVDEVLSVMMPRASERNTRLQTQVWPDVPERIIADPLRLRQILVNIVGNAVKFTETGGIHIELKVVPGQKGGDELCFEITDTGVGFDNSKHRDLFEQFSQVDESSTRKFGGTGLGLAICKRLVEMMNGQIGYDAKLGSGACFWFTLPLLKVQAVPNQPLSTSGAVAHVLSLDPSANRFVTDVESALQSQGFTVKTAPGSTEQITLAAENDALVAVSSGESSLDLPVLEGRSEPTNVILIVPSVDFTVRQSAIKAGFTHLLTFAQAVNAQPPIALATFASQTWLGIRRATSTKSEISTGSEIAQILDPAVAGKPILVIDDIEMNRMIASRQLQQLGLSHDLTTNGSEGLAAACKGDYALILADVSMPVMDGYEFTARWRDWESREGVGRTHVPVIAMTANATSSDAERCVAAGMDDYMSKPVTLDRMSAMILKWIGSGAVTSGEPKPATGSKALLDELSPIDLSVLASIIGSDDRDLLLQMADLFVSTFPGLQTRIEQAIDSQDRGELREAAHAAKGASRNAGSTPLGDILYEIEEGAANLDLADLRDLADQAAKEFGRVLKTLEAEQQGQ